MVSPDALRSRFCDASGRYRTGHPERCRIWIDAAGFVHGAALKASRNCC